MVGIEKYNEIRKRNKANEITLPDISNNKLFLKANNNNNNNNFTTKNISINFESSFHLLNEECYLTLSQGQKKHRVFGKRFEIKAGKIMAKIGDKIMILYKNKTRLNFIFLICSNVDLLNKIYQMLKNKEIIDFLNKTLKINPNCEKQEKKINNCKIIFLNKSYIRIKEDEEKFKQIISSLIDYEYIHFPKLKLSDTIINTNLYLINNNWLQNLKCTLNVLDTTSNKGIYNLNQTEIINIIFKQYKADPSIIRNEIIKDENNLYEYLKDNNTGNYFKLYTDYSLISEELWINLIRYFKWNIEIKVNVYIMSTIKFRNT